MEEAGRPDGPAATGAHAGAEAAPSRPTWARRWAAAVWQGLAQGTHGSPHAPACAEWDQLGPVLQDQRDRARATENEQHAGVPRAA